MTELGDAPFCYLTTVGRRSGDPHTIEIWFARRINPDGDLVFVMSGARDGADWVRNLQEDPRATVRIGSNDAPALSAMAAFPEPGSADDSFARASLVAKYGGPAGDLDQWGRTALVVALELSESSSGE